MDGFRTNIDVIDLMMGNGQERAGGSPVNPGDIIIIRGGPGSGKTTLGLQILSRFLDDRDGKKADGDEKGQVRSAIFISLESPPRAVIERVKSGFGFFRKREEWLTDVNYASLEPLFAGEPGVAFKEAVKKFVDEAGDVSFTVKPGQNQPEVTFKTGTAVIQLLARLGLIGWHTLRSKMAAHDLLPDGLMREAGLEEGGADHIRGLLFIDSLNALLMLARGSLGREGINEDPRAVLNKLCAVLRRVFKNFVIICSSEFHNLATWQASGMSESFVCDAEIVLESEPIMVPIEYTPNKTGSAGYGIFKTLDAGANPENARLETRSFVRIAKLRHGANQSRRCSYDILAGAGLSFYETYPGDGHILLFNENTPQRSIWKKFFKEDVPHLYPTLRYETFDRSSLQNTFSSQRHFNYIPRQTDLYLSSFDNFWISWYSELNWKWAIVKILKQELRGKAAGKWDDHEFFETVNAIHEAMNRQTIIKDRLDEGIRSCLKPANPADVERLSNEVKNILTSQESTVCLQCAISWSLVAEYMDDLGKAETGKDEQDEARRKKVMKAQDEKTFMQKCLLCVLKDGARPDPAPDVPHSVKELFKGAVRDRAAAVCANLRSLLTVGGYKAFLICRGTEIKKTMDRHWPDLKRPEPARFMKKADELLKELLKINRSMPGQRECDWRKAIRAYVANLPAVAGKPGDLLDELSGDLHVSFSKGLYRKTPLAFIKNSLPGRDDLEALAVLAHVYCGIITQFETFGLLREIPEKEIKLFGERNSKIIAELETSPWEDNKPIFRPDTLFSIKKTKRFISIPYDANIGLFVVRKDIIARFRPFLEAHAADYTALIKRICKFVAFGLDNRHGMIERPWTGEHDKELTAGLDLLFRHQRLNPYLINTWEEMIALIAFCNSSTWENKKTRYCFLMETKSASSFYSGFLEIIWNCGGDFVVGSSYTVSNEEETKRNLCHALLLFGIMFHYKVIPFDATFDLDYYADKFARPPLPDGEAEDWIFARHWYSTLIDILSAKKPVSRGRVGDKPDSYEFVWNNPAARMEISHLPVSLSYYLRERGRPKRFSCWGDWHFGISNGSENMALGIDLINNLMSSQRICERADEGACLPTVEAFYELYGTNKCVNVFGRPAGMMPGLTYNKLRRRFFKQGKSRSQIFDYQHCFQEIDSLLKFVQTNSAGFKLDNPEQSLMFFRQLNEEVDKAFKRILAFKTMAMQVN